MATAINQPFTLNETQTLNEIVALYPQTLPVLQRFGLDTCCGGSLSLHTAVEHHALDLDQVRAALQTAIAEKEAP